jgi:hypothetical protein
MTNNMMDWMMGGMGIVWLLIVIVLVLAGGGPYQVLFTSR